jgi:hypothetical protein
LAQVIENLLSKGKPLSSTPNITQKKKKKGDPFVKYLAVKVTNNFHSPLSSSLKKSPFFLATLGF